MKTHQTRRFALLLVPMAGMFLSTGSHAAWTSVSGIPSSVTLKANEKGCGNGLCKPIGISKSTVGHRLSYDVKFNSNFDWSRGGKIPGLAGDKTLAGCNTGDGWSYRVMWRQDGRITPYIYHKDRPTNCGDYFGYANSGSMYFPKGQWTTIRLVVKMNTGNNNDGEATLYVNGIQYFRKTTIKFATTSAERNVSKILAHCYRGGSDSSWSSPIDGTVYFRNVKVNPM